MMTANYNFQHNVLRRAIEFLPDGVLENIIKAQDRDSARRIFYNAMIKANMDFFLKSYRFRCDFAIKNNLPVLIYYFDREVSGAAFVAECFAAVVVAAERNNYYTVEYSVGNEVVLGQWDNITHINYGFYSLDDMDRIVDFATKQSIKRQKSNRETNKQKNAMREKKQKRKKNTYRIGWLCFFYGWQSPIGVIGSAILAFVDFMLASVEGINALFGALALACLPIYALLTVGYFKHRKIGWRRGMFPSWLLTLTFVLLWLQATVSAVYGFVSTELPVGLISGVIWALLNTIYFYRRRVFFERYADSVPKPSSPA